MSSITERRANGGLSALRHRWRLSRSGVAVVTGRWRPVHCQEAKMKTSNIRKPTAPKPISQSATPNKLNESQRNILATTLLREDGAAVRPASMTQRAAQKLAAALIEKGLAREIRATSAARIAANFRVSAMPAPPATSNSTPIRRPAVQDERAGPKDQNYESSWRPCWRPHVSDSASISGRNLWHGSAAGCFLDRSPLDPWRSHWPMLRRCALLAKCAE
jgi:hypothetical protein